MGRKPLWAMGLLALAGCTIPPRGSAPPAQSEKRVLLLTHNTFYNHDNLASIEAVLPLWGTTAGFSVTSLEGYRQTASCTRERPCLPAAVNLSMINDGYLAQFDAIVVSTNGELPFTEPGKQRWSTLSAAARA